MKKPNLSFILLLSFILVFFSCDDDSIFTPKVSISNGTTIVSKMKPGGLEMALGVRLWLIKNLTINDTIDSRDFKTMRDEMPNLQVLDLSNAVIASYNGYEGTGFKSVYRYAANSIPEFAFYNPETSEGKKSLKTIILPNTLRSVKDFAFNNTGISGELIIPASVTDTIGKSAFSYCENLTGVTIPGTKLIGESAFQGCNNLSGNLVLPESVETIKAWAFAYCENIETVNLPSTLSELGQSAFNGCGGLFTVNSANSNFTNQDGVLFNADKSTLIQFPKSKTGHYIVPNSVMSIGVWSFANCTGLTSISVPSSLSVIEDYAFFGCSGLSGNFPVPSGIWMIGQYVFEGCADISGFEVAPDNTSFSYSNGVLSDIGQSILKRCIVSKTGNYIIDPGIMFIDNAAFSDCTKLNSVELHENVLDIGKRAFYNCSGLTSIKVKSATPLDLTNSLSAFEAVDKEKCTLYVPLGTKTLYSDALGWKDFKNIVEN